MCHQRAMGCGRSKPRHPSESSDDTETDRRKANKKKSVSKNDKCVCNPGNKVGDKIENHDASKSLPAKRKDSGVVKMPLKGASTLSSNGVQTQSFNNLDGKKSKLDNVPAVTQNKVRVTNSQLDFFRMLDEKIELGKDYNSDEESEQTANSDEVTHEQ